MVKIVEGVEAAGKHIQHIHDNLGGIAASKIKFHSYRVESFPAYDLKDLTKSKLTGLNGKIVTVRFNEGLRNVIMDATTRFVKLKPIKMETDPQKLSSLFNPIVERTPTTAITILGVKKLPRFFLVDLYKGSAPMNIKWESAQKTLAEKLHHQLSEKNATSVTGLMLQGPHPSGTGLASYLITFRLPFPEDSKTAPGVGYSNMRRHIYQEQFKFDHEDVDLKG